MKASLEVWRIGLMMVKSLRFLLGFVTCVLIVVAAYPHAEAHSGVSLSAYTATPPTIDGNIGANEWAAAGKVNFGPFTADGQTITGTLYMMNDGTNLYIAVSIGGDDDLGGAGGVDGFRIMFDNDHGGEASHEVGDDSVAVFYQFASVFEDVVWGKSLFYDAAFGGTTDGQGAGSRQGALNNFELSHPLDSTDDAHDFSLSIGQTVGFLLTVAVDGWAYFLSAYGLGNWLVPSTYADYVVASPPAPVGGVLTPVNKLDLLAPYLALVGLVGAVSTVFAIRKKRKP